MQKIILFIFIVITSISIVQAQDSLCNVDKLYYGQVQFEGDALESKSYEFYLHLPAGMKANFYYHELAKEKFRKLFLVEAKYNTDLKANFFHFGDAAITIDTSSSEDLLTANLSIRRHYADGINTYDRDDSINVVLMSTDPQEIAEIISVVDENSVVPRPFDRFSYFWANINVLPGRNEYNFQGTFFTYLGKMDTEPYNMMTFNFPNINIVYDKNGYRRYSYQAMAIPIFGAFTSLGLLFEDEDDSFMFAIPGLVFGFLSGLTNPGIDIPIHGGDNYWSFYLKLNWDAFIVEVPDVIDYKQPDNFFVAPKLGFRYMNVSGIGFEAFAGYRFWNFPLTLSHEHAFAGVGLLIPIGAME